MRAAPKTVVETLFVVDRKTGRFLVMKRTAGLKLPPCLLDAHSPPDQRRERRPATQFIQPLRGKRHLSTKRRFHCGSGFAHINLAAMALFELAHYLTHIFQAFRPGFRDNRGNRGFEVIVAHLRR